MKRVLSIFVLLIVLGFYLQVHAALIDRGADNLGYHLIYDSDLNITWYDYTVGPGYGLTWNQAMSWAAGLSVTFGGNTLLGWRLPGTDESKADMLGGYGYAGPDETGYHHYEHGYNMVNSEMGYLYYTELGNKGFWATDGSGPQPGWGLINKGLFNNLQGSSHWSGTEYSPDPTSYAWSFSLAVGAQSGITKVEPLDALAVRPGDVAPVPEPATMLTFGSGFLLGFWRLRKRFKK